MNKLSRFLWCLICAYAVGIWTQICHAEDYGPTARGVFSQLPTSIFENTPEGLNENGKQSLLRTGRSEFWELVEESPDKLLIRQVPFGNRTVSLQLYHNSSDGSVDVVTGIIGDPICTLELWKMDASGRIVPIDAPVEPGIREFYRPSRLPARQRLYSVMLCPHPSGLAATPVYWNEHGMVPVKTDYNILYVWKDGKFEKSIKTSESHTD